MANIPLQKQELGVQKAKGFQGEIHLKTLLHQLSQLTKRGVRH
jgi:hypothetical protein